MKVLKESFNAGVFTPKLHTRYELAKFKNGCKTLTNFIPTPHGPVVRRPGTEYIAEVKDSTDVVRLIPFVFSESDAYMLEFGDAYVRYFRNGGAVAAPDANTKLLLHFDGVNNSTSVTDFSATGHTVTSNGGAKISTANKKIGTASAFFDGSDDYFSLADHADFDFDSGTFTIDCWFRCNYDPEPGCDGTIGIWNQYVDANNYSAFRVYNDRIGFSVRESGSLIISFSSGNQGFDQDTWYHAALIRGWGGGANDYAITINGSVVATNTDSSDYPNFAGGVNIGRYITSGGTSYSDGYIDELRVSTTARWTEEFSPYISEYPGADSSYASAYETVTTYANADINNLYYVQSGDTMYICNENYVVRKLTRTSHTSWSIDDVSFTDAPADWSANDYPRTVEFYEDRLVFGGSPDQPDEIWTSDVGAYETITAGGATSDLSVNVTLGARKVNDIKWLVAGRRLLIGTGGEEWWLSGSSDTEPLDATGLNVAKRTSTKGSARVMPLEVDDTVIYVHESNKRLYAIEYNYGKDKYENADLSILARHLTKTYNITQIAFQKHPFNIIWCVRSDGSLLSLTYLKEHDVIGWALHTSGAGIFKSVAVIPGDPEDEVWFVVEREINSTTKQYIERLKPFNFGSDLNDAFFVDCGLTYDGASVVTIDGLDHLNGETATLLADGDPDVSYMSVDSNTSLLLHFKGADEATYIGDVGYTGHTCTANGTAQIDTSEYKFNTSSLLLDGDSDYVSVADHADWNFGSDEFTIDFWMRPDTTATGSSGTEGAFWEQYESGGDNNHFTFRLYNNTFFVQAKEGVTTISETSSACTIEADTWYHVALIRGWGGETNDWAICLDGSAVHTFTDSSSVSDLGVAANIGRSQVGGTTYFGGHIDEFRVSKGVARWTSDFTAPTTHYPQADSSGSTTIGGGQITFSQAVSKAHVGLESTAEFETLDAIVVKPDGPEQGLPKRITNVSINLIDSQGGVYGPDSDTTDPIIYDDTTSLYSGWTDDLSFDFGSDKTATVYIKCDEPLPMQIAAILMDLED